MTTITDLITAELAIAYDAGPKYTRESVFPFVMGDVEYQTLGDAIRDNDPTLHIRNIFEFQKKNPDIAELMKKKHFYILPELPEPCGHAVHYLRRGIRTNDSTWLQQINACLVARCQELETMNDSLQKHIAQTRAKTITKTNTVVTRIDMAVQVVPPSVPTREHSTNTAAPPILVDCDTETDPIPPVIEYVDRYIEVPKHVPVAFVQEIVPFIEPVECVEERGWALMNKPTWRMSANKQNGRSRRTNARFLEAYDNLFEE